MSPDSPAVMLSAAVGSRSEEWVRSALNQLIGATQPNSVSEIEQQRLNAALAFMSDIDPQNAVEAALGVQMLAAHEAGLDMLRRTRNANMLPQMEAYGNLATKLLRTYTVQLEALARLRRGGEQVIKYVHVHEGGQAVIGSTINQGGQIAKGVEQSHAAGAVPQCAALLSQDEAGDGVPLPLDGERKVSHARRDQSRRSKG